MRTKQRNSLVTPSRRQLEVFARGTDHVSGAPYTIVQFETAAGKKRCLPISNSTFAEGARAIFRELAAAHCPVPASGAARREVIRLIDSADPKREMTVVTAPGWYDDVFVLPHRKFGKRRSGLMAAMKNDHRRDKFSSAGTVRSWAESVYDSFLRGNHVLVAMCGYSLAAPLLELLGSEGGGFQLVAPTGHGKTTAARVAGSLWGGDYLKSWRTTSNAVELTARRHRHLPLILDETAVAEGNARARFDLISSAVYGIWEGRTKARYTDTHPSDRTATLLLSTSETSLPAIARATGREAPGGLQRRLIDVELPFGSQGGIFQDLHGHGDASAFCRALSQALGANHGTIAPAFLRHLAEEVGRDRDELVLRLRKRMAFYERKRQRQGRQRADDLQHGPRFALLYAALRLAQSFKIVPGTRQEAFEAVFHLDRYTLPLPVQSPQSTADPVRHCADYIADHRDAFIKLDAGEKLTTAKIKEVLGLISDKDHGAFLFTAHAFAQMAAPHNPEVVRRELQVRNLLILQGGGKRTVTRTLPRIGRQRFTVIRSAIADCAPGSRVESSAPSPLRSKARRHLKQT